MNGQQAPEASSNPKHGHVEVDRLSKSFEMGSHQVEVLRDVSFEVPSGGSLAIVGPSGSGKSTLLHVIGALETPTSGRVVVDGFDPAGASEGELADFRNRRVGFVFQDHHLLPQFSVLQNVLLPTLAGRSTTSSRQRAEELLARVGLAARVEHRPAQLSGGERQRAAIARALINRPSVLLCDEPTGNLDRNTAESVAELLFELQAQEHSSLIVVTHSAELASRFPDQIALA